MAYFLTSRKDNELLIYAVGTVLVRQADVLVMLGS